MAALILQVPAVKRNEIALEYPPLASEMTPWYWVPTMVLLFLSWLVPSRNSTHCLSGPRNFCVCSRCLGITAGEVRELRHLFRGFARLLGDVVNGYEQSGTLGLCSFHLSVIRIR
jgi:hypothetical protein